MPKPEQPSNFFVEFLILVGVLAFALGAAALALPPALIAVVVGAASIWWAWRQVRRF